MNADATNSFTSTKPLDRYNRRGLPKTGLLNRLLANIDKSSKRAGLHVGAILAESGVDIDKESQHENSREDHTFCGFGWTAGGPRRRAVAGT